MYKGNPLPIKYLTSDSKLLKARIGELRDILFNRQLRSNIDDQYFEYSILLEIYLLILKHKNNNFMKWVIKELIFV
jgi:hypothetical protein